MDVIEAIKGRRSIRKFKKEKIKDEVLTKILEAAIHAPSSGNLQNWEFIVVRDEKSKQRISEIAYGQDFLSDADVLIIICSNQKRMIRYGERGRILYSIQNTSAAIQNMLLAAYCFGIGSCWVGAFDDYELSVFLKLPNYVKPHAIIALGYPDEKPRMPERIPLKEIVYSEKYDKKYIE